MIQHRTISFNINNLYKTRGIQISHLFFVDESVLFTKATTSASLATCNLLKTYEEVSVQKVNVDKTRVYFSPNTDMATRRSILQSIGTENAKGYTKYLGLATFVGRSKTNIFQNLKQRVWSKLKGLKE
ncbi:hypothetical protein CFOL_v3_22461 [Cephalotus follicularis]|uniref:Uncharacterized protein n=1 Tax=Cephalotus follicularis TaxID=3775 RepID=A0A1Q3CFF8_CEPFO|nr:hypothetical protein CFOL_v3_22461 [Cephalotus follicularis]